MSCLLSFSSALTYIGYIAIAIVVLLLMVLIHELGHYTAGKILKFKINEFSVGFGPKILQKTKKNGEVISLRAFPLGGYCAFEGEDEEGKENPLAFNNQKPWKRLIVLFSGAFFNFLSAIIFSFILLLANGYDLVQVKTVPEQSINYNIMQTGDVIYGVNNKNIDFVNDDYITTLITDYVMNNFKTYSGENLLEAGEPFEDENNETFYLVQEILPLNIKRNGKTQLLECKINIIYASDGSLASWPAPGYETMNDVFGVQIHTYKYSFFEALAQAVPFTFKWAWKVLVVLFQLITGKLSIKALGGPVTTINMIASATQTNFVNILVLLPAIAANLAVFNLLPIPALDGFQMVFVAIEWIRKKPVKRSVINAINNIGLLLLLGFVIIVDILQFAL